MKHNSLEKSDTVFHASVQESGGETNCPVCCCEIEPEEEFVICPNCTTKFHKECWNENKGCATYGCRSVGCLDQSSLKVDVATESPVSEDFSLPYFGRQEEEPFEKKRLGIPAIILLAGGQACFMGAIFADYRGNVSGYIVFGVILSIIGIFLGILYCTKLEPPSESVIICPNHKCDYTGPAERKGPDTLLAVMLLFLWGIPAILYALITGPRQMVCPKCGMRVR